MFVTLGFGSHLPFLRAIPWFRDPKPKGTNPKGTNENFLIEITTPRTNMAAEQVCSVDYCPAKFGLRGLLYGVPGVQRFRSLGSGFWTF